MIIGDAISKAIKEIESLYPTLQEASEDKFVDVLTKRIKDKVKTSRLKQRRIICGLSQNELSLKSSIKMWNWRFTRTNMTLKQKTN